MRTRRLSTSASWPVIFIRLPRHRRRLVLVILLPTIAALAATAAWVVGMRRAHPGYGFWPAITGRLLPVQQLTDSDTSALVNPALYGPVTTDSPGPPTRRSGFSSSSRSIRQRS